MKDLSSLAPEQLNKLIMGSQCRKCHGFPTQLSIFQNAKALFKECNCTSEMLDHAPMSYSDFGALLIALGWDAEDVRDSFSDAYEL